MDELEQRRGRKMITDQNSDPKPDAGPEALQAAIDRLTAAIRANTAEREKLNELIASLDRAQDSITRPEAAKS